MITAKKFHTKSEPVMLMKTKIPPLLVLLAGWGVV